MYCGFITRFLLGILVLNGDQIQTQPHMCIQICKNEDNDSTEMFLTSTAYIDGVLTASKKFVNSILLSIYKWAECAPDTFKLASIYRK